MALRDFKEFKRLGVAQVKIEDIPDFSKRRSYGRQCGSASPDRAPLLSCHREGQVKRLREAGISDCHNAVMTLTQYQPSLPSDILTCERRKPLQA